MSNSNDVQVDMPQIGDTLVGKYRIEEILGKGGMGVVAAARHLKLGQRVAIKFLIHSDHEETVARFLREARAAVRLRSEHVARVLDVGQLETGSPYMVMEYLEGCDLMRHVRTNGPLEVADAVLHVLQTCEAIAEAHAAGIIHRDLKPANLFLTTTPDGETCVKVLDFGISKTNDKADDGGQAYSLTNVDDILGSPLYMPPEQLKSSKNVDVRSDVWSIGVILYQLLTGQTPWYSNILHELVLSIATDPPPPVSKFRQDVPAQLEAAIMKCLEKKREHRFENVAELAWAIAEFGPARANLSAKRATRLLEAAGIRVQTPSGEAVMLSLRTPTLPAMTNPPPVSTADPVADTVLPTVSKARAAPKQKRSLGLVMAMGVMVVAAIGLTWNFHRGSTSLPQSLPTQAAPNAEVTPEITPSPDSSLDMNSTAPTAPAPSSSVGRPDATKQTVKTNPMVKERTNGNQKIAQPLLNQSAPSAQPETKSPMAPAPSPTPTTTTKRSLKSLDTLQ